MREDNSDNYIEVYDNYSNVTDIIGEKTQNNSETEAFFVCEIDDIVSKYKLWKSTFPRIKPFYAIKCNNNHMITKILGSLGVNFDCATKNEIDQVLSLGIAANRIIYAHTMKPRAYLKHAANVGIELVTFDSELELRKMKEIHPNVKAVLRINPGEKKKIPKFGCNVSTEANQLISLASELKIDLVGVSFHIGSYSKDMDSYEIAIKLARDVFNLAAKCGFNLRILDIGGAYSGTNKNDFRNAAKLINEALDNYFSDLSVEIMAEPGAFFVDSALTLACNVVSKKYCSDQWAYYINDGVYGSFRVRSKIHLPLKMHSLKKYADKKLYSSAIFGATCANTDELTNSISLPALDIGDWLIFKNMGAYTISACTTFNGFPIPSVNNVISLKTWSELKDIFGLNDDYIKYKELKKNEEYQFNSDEEFGLTFTIEEGICYSG